MNVVKVADWIKRQSRVQLQPVHLSGSYYQIFLEGYTVTRRKQDGTVSFTSHCNPGQPFLFSQMDYDKGDVLLGKGSCGSVYRRTFRGDHVAVKKVQLVDLDKREEEAMRELSHPNVIRLFDTREEGEFK